MDMDFTGLEEPIDRTRQYYELNDGELNLARMEIETIKRAFSKFPSKKAIFIALQLGIAHHALKNKLKYYNLDTKEMRAGANVEKKRYVKLK